MRTPTVLKTLLMFNYEVQLARKMQLNYFLSPLIQMRTFELFNIKIKPLSLPLKLSTLSQNTILETLGIRTHSIGSLRLQQPFSTVIIINTPNQSNARRKVLINKKRQSLLTFFQQMGENSRIYDIHMNKANHFVPDQELIIHLRHAFKANKQTLKNNQKYPKKTQKRLVNVQQKNRLNKDKTRELESLESLYYALFPYKHSLWMKIMRQRIPNNQPKTAQSIEKSFLQIQFYCLYRFHYSKNRLNLYLDLKDFLNANLKFNFIQFYSTVQENQVRVKRLIERLFRSLKWRTNQTLQMLLHIRRSFWIKQFFFVIQTLIECYQSIFSKIELESLDQKQSQIYQLSEKEQFKNRYIDFN